MHLKQAAGFLEACAPMQGTAEGGGAVGRCKRGGGGKQVALDQAAAAVHSALALALTWHRAHAWLLKLAGQPAGRGARGWAPALPLTKPSAAAPVALVSGLFASCTTFRLHIWYGQAPLLVQPGPKEPKVAAEAGLGPRDLRYAAHEPGWPQPLGLLQKVQALQPLVAEQCAQQSAALATVGAMPPCW